ncbi:MAG TPA: SH3 domain-containing protein [Bryobacteraceae bacterium]|nr:SH3 domain-containing protein [Bryobacteraceae bacterium]
MHSEGNGPSTLTNFILVFVGFLTLAGCARDTGDVFARAYVAPEKLTVRRELTQKNNTAAVLNHGDQVEIIDVHRRFVKVRTRKGDEGWVDSLQLLSQEQMDQIRRDSRQYLSLPSEGTAGVYETLNVHLEPSRTSPAFTKIPEGGSVAVLAYRLAPKATTAPKPPNFASERPQPERRSRKQHVAKRSFLPAPPPPPKPPENWQEISSGKIDGAESTAEQKTRKDQEAAEKKAAELKKPVVLESWALVRTKDKQVGWVLSRNLVMSIPDEVAQYAEGKRITSYFDLGPVQDEEKGVKHNWLWTTASEQQTCDFDAWRVFLWNRRRHRYETSYRQRDLEGYFPVHVDTADANAFDRTFEIITKDDDGKLRQRRYSFDGTRVHLMGTEDYRPGGSEEVTKAKGIDTNKLQKMPHQNWLKRQWTSIKQRLSGR